MDSLPLRDIRPRKFGRTTMKTFLRGSVAATVLLASSAFAAEPVAISEEAPAAFSDS